VISIRALYALYFTADDDDNDDDDYDDNDGDDDDDDMLFSRAIAQHTCP
jgi:hypothetical protein